MLLKAVCLTSASLAVHSNVIEELQEFHELQNLKITIKLTNDALLCNIRNKIVIHSWLIPDELASCMLPGF